MAPAFLPAISPSQGLDDNTGGRLSYLKGIFSPVFPEDVQATIERLQKYLEIFDFHLDVTSLGDIDDIIAVLDAGAYKIFTTPGQAEVLSQTDNIDQGRVIPAVNGEQDEMSGACRDNHTAIYFARTPPLTPFLEALAKRQHDDGTVYVLVTEPENSTDVALKIAKAGAVPIVPLEYLNLGQQARPEALSVADLVMVRAVSDRPDELYQTLVTDERGIALGVVYSSRESVAESLKIGRGVYHSRKRGLWYKGETSGDIQELVSLDFDCDHDCLRFVVRQKGKGKSVWSCHFIHLTIYTGFCHLGTATCFGDYHGLARLQKTLQQRKESAPAGSYTARLFNDPQLLNAKIKEEADELCEATEKDHIAFEAADLLYFALTKCISAGVSLDDVERNLDAKSTKVKRRKGDAKPQYTINGDFKPVPTIGTTAAKSLSLQESSHTQEIIKEAASVPKGPNDPAGISPITSTIRMTHHDTTIVPASTIANALQRPSQRTTDKIMSIVKPIISSVQTAGDAALLGYTAQFEHANLASPILRAPFPASLMRLSENTKEAIDIAYNNIHTFHAAQRETAPLVVNTMPGIACTRFSRAIERVGLYVPGGTAVLPSTALMLGIPAKVAGCRTIVLATPPRPDGTVTPEIVYIAHRIGASCIVLAGGAQAVAAMAYGTESVPKCHKILGPGNQFVTAAKMLVSNDTSAAVGIDMPAGPSEVLVIADAQAEPSFVAADLLSQAEHGTDSQVVLIAIALNQPQLDAIDAELDAQARALPRADVVRGAIAHSVTLSVRDLAEAMRLSNEYAPEHLILNLAQPALDEAVSLVENAGSVFIGPYAPESVGDYAAGVNHALPTYGYARQYSGVSLASFTKHITSSRLTREGLANVGGAVVELAECEGLSAHARAVKVRLAKMANE